MRRAMDVLAEYNEYNAKYHKAYDRYYEASRGFFSFLYSDEEREVRRDTLTSIELHLEQLRQELRTHSIYR